MEPESDACPAPVRLVLEDGSEYLGRGFGASAPVAGEVVFNTAMAGYVETLTDPSYRGQLLLLTYPLVGNYGAPPPRTTTLERPYESVRIQPQALIVQHYSAHYSHHAAARALGAWLREEGVPGMTGVDTRALTRTLRARGTMRGWLFPASLTLDEARRGARAVDMEEEVFRVVAPSEPITYEGGEKRVLLVDCGAKDHLVRSLLERGASVTRVPWHAELARHAQGADAVLIGNGPGDPARLEALTAQVRRLLADFPGPVFGVCLGHQILALAAGARTYKLKYGHRGVNQPVRDLLTGRCYVTSQNHGYAVEEGSLPPGFVPWFVNVNDGTNEGLRARHRPHWGVQFHPEGSPGPRDAAHLFDEFLKAAARGGRP